MRGTRDVRGVALDLFRDQELDDGEWSQTRTLYMLSQRWQTHSLPAQRSAPEARAGDGWATAFPAGARVVRDHPAQDPRIGPLLPPSELPLRHALSTDPTVAAAVVDDPAWTRVVLGLYGGVAFADVRRREAARMRLTSDREDTALAPAWRRHAAIAVDLGTSEPGADFAATATNLDPAAVVVDSPLTDRLLGWLRAGTPVDEVDAALLVLASAAGISPDLRGDALVAAALLGRRAASWDGLDEPTTRRVRWRLGRALLVLADAVQRIDAGRVSRGFDVLRLPGNEQVALDAAIIRATTAISGRRAGWGGLLDGHLPLSLVEVVNRVSPDTTYNLAVYLDTAGARLVEAQGVGLAGMLSTIAHRAGGAVGDGERWPLDPLAPRAGHRLAETLTALAALRPELAFLRCWLLDRLAGELTESGFAVEAAYLAHGDLDIDPVSARRTLTRLGLAAPYPAALKEAADRVGDPYAAARTRLRAAHACGERVSTPALTAAASEVPRGDDRMRLLELALDLSVAADEAAVVAALPPLVAQITSPTERALATARVARLTGADLRAHTLPVLAFAPQEEIADVVQRLPDTPDGDQPTLTNPTLRALAAKALAEPLLDQERRHRPPNGWADNPRTRLPLAWALVTAGAVCADGLTALGGSSPDTSAHVPGAWQDLLDPATRETAARTLIRRGTALPIPLDVTAVAVLDRVAAEGDTSTVTSILEVARAWRRDPVVRRWQTGGVQGVRDLAALLGLEWGELTEPAAAALPRLFDHPADPVRARTWRAVTALAAGRRRLPRFRASAAGAAALARLARNVATAYRPAVAAGLWTAQVEIGHDSPTVLRESLAATEGEPAARIALLRGVRRPIGLPASTLPALAASLSVGERRALVHSLAFVADAPDRSGVDQAWVRELIPVAAGFVTDPDPAVVGAALELVGRCGTGEPAVVAALCAEADGDLADPRVAGACAGLGHLLGAGGLESAARQRAVGILRDQAAAPDGSAVVTAALLRAGALPNGVAPAVHALAVATTTTSSPAESDRWLDMLTTLAATDPAAFAAAVVDVAATAEDLADPAVLDRADLPFDAVHLGVACQMITHLGRRSPVEVRTALSARPDVVARIRNQRERGGLNVAHHATGLLLMLDPATGLPTAVEAAAGAPGLEADLAAIVAGLPPMSGAAVSGLIALVGDASSARACFAARLMRVLTSHALIDADTRQACADAAAEASRSDHAAVLRVTVDREELRDAGTVADVLADAADRIRAGGAVPTETPTFRLLVPTPGGTDLELVLPDQATVTNLADSQLQVLDGTAEAEVGRSLTPALAGAARRAAATGSALSDAVEAVITSPPR